MISLKKIYFVSTLLTINLLFNVSCNNKKSRQQTAPPVTIEDKVSTQKLLIQSKEDLSKLLDNDTLLIFNKDPQRRNFEFIDNSISETKTLNDIIQKVTDLNKLSLKVERSHDKLLKDGPSVYDEVLKLNMNLRVAQISLNNMQQYFSNCKENSLTLLNKLERLNNSSSFSLDILLPIRIKRKTQNDHEVFHSTYLINLGLGLKNHLSSFDLEDINTAYTQIKNDPNCKYSFAENLAYNMTEAINYTNDYISITNLINLSFDEFSKLEKLHLYHIKKHDENSSSQEMVFFILEKSHKKVRLTLYDYYENQVYPQDNSRLSPSQKFEAKVKEISRLLLSAMDIFNDNKNLKRGKTHNDSKTLEEKYKEAAVYYSLLKAPDSNYLRFIDRGYNIN